MHVPLQVVVSDVPTCGGVAYAQQHGIPTLTYPIPKKAGFPGLTPEELVAALKSGSHASDFVILAGYLKVRAVAQDAFVLPHLYACQWLTSCTAGYARLTAGEPMQSRYVG